MEIQMRKSYANAKKILGQFAASLDNVVEEVLYLTDVEKALAAAGPVGKEAYGSQKPKWRARFWSRDLPSPRN